MSATKGTHGYPASLPTEADLAAIEEKLSAAHNVVEDLSVRVGRAIAPWMDKGEILERPTFETLGVLTEIVDLVETEVEAITREIESLKVDGRQLMTMRVDQPKVAVTS